MVGVMDNRSYRWECELAEATRIENGVLKERLVGCSDFAIVVACLGV